MNKLYFSDNLQILHEMDSERVLSTSIIGVCNVRAKQL